MAINNPLRHAPPKRLRGIQVGAAVYNRKQSVHIRRHAHRYFELLYILEGIRTLITPRGRYEAKPGELIIFYPKETHEEFEPAGKLAYVALRFPQSVLGRKFRFPEKRSTPPVFRLPWTERFRHLFEQMLAERDTRDAWSDTLIRTYLIGFILLLHRAVHALKSGQQDASQSRPLLIEKTLAIIHAGITSEFSLKEVAHQAGMSPSRLSHVFKEISGMPPKHYYLQTKMAWAQELLATTHQSVKAIATKVGYLDEHYFSRVFKKLIGAAPTQYRAGRK